MSFEINPKKFKVGEPIPPGNLFRRWWVWAAAVSLLGIVVLAQLNRSSGQTTTGQSPAAQPVVGLNKPGTPLPAPVTAVAAQKSDINVFLTGLGTVTPLRTVTVKSRVDGELVRVLYKEGQIVTKGALLAEIDPRPYQAQLTQAEGQMIRDQALLQNARLDQERYRVLSTQDSIAKQQYDTQKSLVRQLQGTVKFDQGQIDNAKLQLVYARITAPVSGRIGLRVVDPGNIIHATDATGLCIITQLEPITVVFTIPEDSLLPVLDKLRAGAHLAVEAYNREQSRKLASGSLLTMDNQIDPNSGTVRLKALFTNKDHMLFPNQFVNAHLLLEIRRGVVVVPTAAVQRSSQGTFVFLVKADHTVTMRPVKLGPSEADRVEVDEGLAPGDVVVVEGAERLREGSKVEIKEPGDHNSRKTK
jgi:membrane fusion protein, multidrug efflux system